MSVPSLMTTGSSPDSLLTSVSQTPSHPLTHADDTKILDLGWYPALDMLTVVPVQLFFAERSIKIKQSFPLHRLRRYHPHTGYNRLCHRSGDIDRTSNRAHRHDHDPVVHDGLYLYSCGPHNRCSLRIAEGSKVWRGRLGVQDESDPGSLDQVRPLPLHWPSR